MSYQWKGRWTGVNVPTFTCFTPDFKVDYEATRALFRRLVGTTGIAGIAVNVHTGEGEVLTIEERKNIIEIAKEEAKGKIPVATGIHADTYEEGVKQAQEMEETGVDALMILAPNIYLWDAREAPEYGIEYHKAIAKKVKLPLVMHQVYGTAHEYPTDALAKMFKEIDTLVAVKLANGWHTRWTKFEEDLRALRAVGRDNISLFPGSQHFTTFLWGVDGAWTGFGNFAGEHLVALFNAARQGNVSEEKRLYDKKYPLENALYGAPMVNLIARYKGAAYMCGLIPSPTVRPPKLPLSDQEKKRLREALEKAEMLPAK
jgi:4-hydroxy-tetrahydrodipicolinate synthase